MVGWTDFSHVSVRAVFVLIWVLCRTSACCKDSLCFYTKHSDETISAGSNSSNGSQTQPWAPPPLIGTYTRTLENLLRIEVDIPVIAKRRVMNRGRLPIPHLLSLFDLGLPATTSTVRPAQTLHCSHLASTSHRSSWVVSLGPKCG